MENTMEPICKTVQPVALRGRIRQRDGLNLIELAIVMAVVGLIIGGIYVAASSVYRNVRESQMQDDLLQMVQNVKSTYGVQGQIPSGAIAAGTLIAAGIAPSDMIQGVAGSQVVNDPWGSQVTISGLTTTPAEAEFDLPGIPQSVCSDLLVKNSMLGTSGAANSGLVAAGIGPGTGSLTAAANFPITPSQATAACATPTNTVTFVFQIQ